MLTPQEVSERSFNKASFGGYNMGQVDEFLDILTHDYSALFSENAVLKSKMKVLVDKVEEYRSTEGAMRKALMSAQQMADDMIKEAEKKRDEILKDVDSELSRRREELKDQLSAEEFRLQQAQEATASFVEQVRTLYAKQESVLAGLKDLVPEAPAMTDRVEQTAAEIEENVQRLLSQEAQPEQVQQAEEGLDNTAEFISVAMTQPAEEQSKEDDEAEQKKFGTLKFGQDYEIK